MRMYEEHTLNQALVDLKNLRKAPPEEISLQSEGIFMSMPMVEEWDLQHAYRCDCKVSIKFWSYVSSRCTDYFDLLFFLFSFLHKVIPGHTISLHFIA